MEWNSQPLPIWTRAPSGVSAFRPSWDSPLFPGPRQEAQDSLGTAPRAVGHGKVRYRDASEEHGAADAVVLLGQHLGNVSPLQPPPHLPTEKGT